MKLLALDTSSDACTVAVRHGESVASRHSEVAREHTRILMPMIREVMAEAGLAFEELDAVVLGNGPGSFIGMRIGAAVSQGIAFAARVPVVPVSSMAALAAEVARTTGADHVAVAQDAHMREVYFGLYRSSADGFVEPASEERLAGLGPVSELEALDGAMPIAAGKGWALYPDLRALNAPFLAGDCPLAVPDARYLLELGARGFDRGDAIDPVAVNPAYLRQKVAAVPARKSP